MKFENWFLLTIWNSINTSRFSFISFKKKKYILKTQALSITENSHLMTLDFKLWLLFLEVFFHIKFSCLVVSDSLWHHGLQHTRFPCPSPTPGPCSKLMSIESLMPSNHLILCHPLILPPSIFPSIRVFSNESVLQIRWPKCWTSASASVLPMNTQDWSPLGGLVGTLLAVQEILKSLLQHHSSKASILWCSAFFRVQLSHPYMTTGKTTALTRWNFVGKVMSLLFNMLSRLVIVFLPRTKHLLISWLKPPSASAVILVPKKIKSLTVPLFLHLFATKW